MGGKRWSTLDLAGRALTLITAAGGWADEAARLGLCVRQVGRDTAGWTGGTAWHGWTGQAGIGDKGALLLRPDHVVAWRSPEPPGDPDELGKATALLLGRGTGETKL